MKKLKTSRKFNKKAFNPNAVNFSIFKFTFTRKAQLSNIREFVLERLLKLPDINEWLLRSHDADEVFSNARLADFFNNHFDGRKLQDRLVYYNKRVCLDRDRVRLHGQYYNNIYLGKRIFGPSRKQVFTHTIVGGMERRFEILDNQVNHIPFTHEMFDKFSEKCRNPRIKCRDDTRVVLKYPNIGLLDDFIHANRINAPLLFNEFILTQAPLENTIEDFWRMVWQEEVRYIFMLISRKNSNRCAGYWPKKKSDSMSFHGLTIYTEEVSDFDDTLFRVTKIRIVGPKNKELFVEHWQGDLNNSDNVQTPLRLLRLARNCTRPTVIHDHLGVSRAATLVAIELCIVNLLKGPSYKYPVQRAVHYLRSFRPFSVETPIQYIFIHRVLQQFIRGLIGEPKGFEDDYKRWLDERSHRPFVEDPEDSIPAYRLLSPKVDPDLLPLVRRRERPEDRREIHACVGELPLPIDRTDANTLMLLPSKYPKGKRY